MELAFGAVPGELAARSKVLRGEPARVLADIASQSGDVLVVGAGRRGPARPLACHISRYCVAHARCPVLAVPPPALARISHGPRGWAFRHRGLKPELASLSAD